MPAIRLTFALRHYMMLEADVTEEQLTNIRAKDEQTLVDWAADQLSKHIDPTKRTADDPPPYDEHFDCQDADVGEAQCCFIDCNPKGDVNDTAGQGWPDTLLEV